MCGIAGFVHPKREAPPASVLERMTGSIRHRGPDAAGTYCDADVSLGHRRLSIIDLGSGIQPMSNEDGSLWIVYNGELFNHAGLRPDLERAGHRYKTRCDTETILHAYEQFGPACLARFRGMFAFALWHPSSRTLFCARDRLGIKPFYYFCDGRTFIFASEIKALLEHPAVSPACDPCSLPEYLALGYNTGEATLFAGVRKLLPGHHLTLTLRDGRPFEPEIRRYWDVPQAAAPPRPDADWIHDCRARLEETVRMRLMSDVPLGVFLSGGVDSSAIAALMSRMVEKPVSTFAVGYGERAYSELGYSARVARVLGTDHHEVVVSRDDFFNALPRLIWHEDEPLAWPSSVSLFFVSQLASRHVKVVLTGEGSDELFGGYARYHTCLANLQAARYYGLFPAFLRRRVRDFVAGSALLSGNLRRKLMHTVLGRESSLEALYLDDFYSAFGPAEQSALWRSLDGSPPPYQGFFGFWNAAASGSLLGRMLYADQKTYLVELLMKQDQMSMASSIESRVPFLDHPLVEFAASVPDHLKIHHGTAKYILKKAVADLLPPEIVHRRKMGFPTPLRQWLRDPQAGSIFATLRRPHGLLADYLDRGRLDLLIDRHARGLQDATDRLWRLLNLQLWGDAFLSGKPAA